MKKHKKMNARTVIATALFITLLFSLLFSVIRFITAPEVIGEGEEYRKVKSDYLLMALQCFMGIVVMMLPTFISHKWRLVVPSVMCILYYLFLYCAVFLGEIFSFYYKIPHWDSLLHAASGGMLGALGFILVDWLNTDEGVKVTLSPAFVSLFAFSFALAIGAAWEIYEFSFDSLLGLNMQKAYLENGTALVGGSALADTMKDLIIDALSALAVATVGFVTLLRRKRAEGA